MQQLQTTSFAQQAAVPHDRNPLFSLGDLCQYSAYKSWDIERCNAAVCGEISPDVLNNERRVVRRFLRHVVEIGQQIEHRTSQGVEASNLAITEQRRFFSRLAPNFLQDPFARPLPLAADFFRTLGSPGAVATAKTILKRFLLAANPSFDIALLDYVTHTAANARHPFVEEWISTADKSTAIQVNHRLRVKRLLSYIAKAALGSELHELDMQSELEALAELKGRQSLSDHHLSGTLLGVLIRYGGTVLAPFFKQHPQCNDKHYRYSLGPFLAHLNHVRMQMKPVLPLEHWSFDVAAAEEPAQQPAVAIVRTPSAVESDPLSGTLPPPPKIRKEKREPIAGQSHGERRPAASVKRPSMSPRQSAPSQEAESSKPAKQLAPAHAKEFLAAAQARLKEMNFVHSVGFEVELAMAMRDLLIFTLRSQQGLRAEEICSLRVQDFAEPRVCLPGRTTPLSNELRAWANVYVQSLRGIPRFGSWFTSHDGNPPLVFSIPRQSPAPLTLSECQSVLDDRDL